MFKLARCASIGALVVCSMLLAGCASTRIGQAIESTFSIVGTAQAATIRPGVVTAAAGTYDALEVTGKNYLKLKRCPVNAPLCRDPRATKPLINAFIAGRKARNAAIKFVQAHPCPASQPSCEIGAGGVYDALQVTITTLQNIIANYNVNAVVH